MTGSDLERIESAERERRIATTRVFARVSPEQKIDIVRAFQAAGNFVAMTGDGVNDAPALRRANIGISMGQNGTDVARAASDMVLLDDDFSTIVAAIYEGRRIFENVRKFVRYTMTSNAGEIWTLLLAPLLGLPIPLLPVHILWINLVTDGLPGLAFSSEPAEPGTMQRPPRPSDESVFAGGMWQQILWVGLLIGGLSITTQSFALSQEIPHWQTLVFTVLTFSQLFNCLALRSESESLRSQGLFSNSPMLIAIGATLSVQLAAIYWPPLQRLLQTQALTASELCLCIGMSLVVPGVVEAEKWWRRRHGRSCENTLLQVRV